MDMAEPEFDPIGLLSDGCARVTQLSESLRQYRQDLCTQTRHRSQKDVAAGLAALDRAIAAAERASRALGSAASKVEEGL